jgi:hypothetical protein
MRFLFLVILLGGCFTPIASTASAPTEPAPDDAALAAEAAARIGGAELTGTVEGLANWSTWSFAAEAGRCYDLAISASEALTAVIMVYPGDTSIYPSPYGHTEQGRVVAYTHCTDAGGELGLQLIAYQALRPGEMSAMGRRARFAIAVRSRPEEPDQRAARHAIERARYLNEREAACDELGTSDGFRCMQELEADLGARDALSARPGTPS